MDFKASVEKDGQTLSPVLAEEEAAAGSGAGGAAALSKSSSAPEGRAED